MQRRSNKIMAVLLSIVLIFSCLAGFPAMAETESEIATAWDATALAALRIYIPKS